jgi:hypothetical protein
MREECGVESDPPEGARVRSGSPEVVRAARDAVGEHAEGGMVLLFEGGSDIHRFRAPKRPRASGVL